MKHKFPNLNQKGLAHYFVPALIILICAVGGTFLLVYSRADSLNPYRGNLTVTTYYRADDVQNLTGNVLITPANVGVNDQCPRTPSKTDQTKGTNYGMIHYLDCPVAYSTNNNHAKQYDVTATIPDFLIADPNFIAQTGAKVNGQNITVRTTLYYGQTTDVKFVFMQKGVGNISNTSTRNRIGGGAWLTNIPSGYYMGKVFDGWHIDINKFSPSGYAFGYINSPDGTAYGCAWIEPGLVPITSKLTNLSCAGKDIDLQNRDTIGANYNCADHICVDGAPTSPVAGCNLAYYYNYQNGQFLNYAGMISPSETLYYRFTTLDGKAAVVRSKILGWGIISKSCISGYPQGGTLK